MPPDLEFFKEVKMSMDKESEVMEYELSKTDMSYVPSVSQQKGSFFFFYRIYKPAFEN